MTAGQKENNYDKLNRDDFGSIAKKNALKFGEKNDLWITG